MAFTISRIFSLQIEDAILWIFLSGGTRFCFHPSSQKFLCFFRLSKISDQVIYIILIESYRFEGAKKVITTIFKVSLRCWIGCTELRLYRRITKTQNKSNSRLQGWINHLEPFLRMFLVKLAKQK